MMVQSLADNPATGRLLLIDADPAMGLLSALGVSVRRTMGEVREAIIETAKGGKDEEKAKISDMLDYMVFEALTELDRFSILAMGRTETLGCFCPVNKLLRAAIETLSENFDTDRRPMLQRGFRISSWWLARTDSQPGSPGFALLGHLFRVLCLSSYFSGDSFFRNFFISRM